MNANEESVFAEALDKQNVQERAAFLDQACAGNPGLRQSVESLLSAYGAGEFLEAAATGLGTIDVPPIVERPGAEIGPYKLLEQIGEGGMGLVFQAEQTRPVRRRVALKIIKPGMDSKQVIARFEAERQALALMEHPNIARVLDAGTTDSGRPYFVMELVRGIPITDYCDERKLTIRQRLELFMQVCQAVQHAHQKGIIHRDLKPTNVLVAHDDTVPLPKVIDFGIAKATGQSLTDSTLFTAISQVVGTPRYMSPEQAALNHLDVDTRSDVYSLGVLLYELLTGTTPFEEDRLRKLGLDEVRRIIREEEPPRPSMRASTLGAALTTVSQRRGVDPRRMSVTLRGELDWIVMKALEKDRNRRYETASGFAADVQRYLNDEPVQACPPSAGYRFRKFARRNKAATAVAFAVLLAVVALAVSTGLIWNAHEQRAAALAQANTNYREAEKQRLRAEENLKQALDLVDGQLDWANQLQRQRNFEGAERVRQQVRAVLEPAVVNYPTNQQYRFQLAFTCSSLGYQYWDLDRLPEAARAFSQYAAMWETLHADYAASDPEDAQGKLSDSLGTLYIVYEEWGRILRANGQRQEAEQVWGRRLETYTAWEKVLKPVMKPHPYEVDVAVAQINWATALADTGQVQRAEALYEQGLKRLEQLPPDFDFEGTRAYGFDSSPARGWVRLGDLKWATGQLKEARAAYRQALEYLPKKIIRFQEYAVRMQCEVAWILATCPEPKYRNAPQAVEYARKRAEHEQHTLKIARDRAAKEQNEVNHPNSAYPYHVLGVALCRAGDWPAGLAELEKAQKLGTRKDTEYWEYFGGHAANGFFQAMAHWHVGAKEQARPCYDRAVQWMEQQRPHDAQLRRFRAETAELLGIEKPATPKKD